jgi:hypothetical protein
MTTAAWSARADGDTESDVDLDRVAAAVTRNFSNLNL